MALVPRLNPLSRLPAISSNPIRSCSCSRSICFSPSSFSPKYNRFNKSGQRQPYPPILSDFQQKVLGLPKSDPQAGWKVEVPNSSPPGGRRDEHRGQNQGAGAGFSPRQKLVGVAAIGASIYYVYHLERVPETGRLRFIDISHSAETAMGLYFQTVSWSSPSKLT